MALRRRGQADPKARADTELLAFERTTKLVTVGIFRYIRHPMYCSLLLLTWGLFFKDPSSTGAALASAATLSLLLTAKADEAECIRGVRRRLPQLHAADEDVHPVRLVEP